VLFERSTPPLYFKKLFCWGNHRAGKHWQEFLSDEGCGYYAEIQAGIAPSQLHDKVMEANSTLEWTQCFGGITGDKAQLFHEDYYVAKNYLGALIDARTSEEGILALNEKLKAYADIPVTPEKLVHLGSGFGAVEIKRMAKEGIAAPAALCFPDFTIGKYERPWLYLLENGILPEEDPAEFVPTYNTSLPWLRLIEESLKREGGNTWYSRMLEGVAVYDGADHTKHASEAYSDEDNLARTERAEKAWLESIKLCPSFIAYRNLARLEFDRDNKETAEYYYTIALAQRGAYDDFALCAEYFEVLVSMQKYEKLWESFISLPTNCSTQDRVRIFAARAAVKLDKFEYLDEFFREDHYDIREGECSLTDIWFEFVARRLATERGIEKTPEKIEALMEEATEAYPPDPKIDFRMSLSKAAKYRV
jgi:hypothetical protein